MALIRKNTAEGGTHSTVVSNANSGGASGDAFSAIVGSPTFSNAQAIDSSLSLAIPAGTTSNSLQWTSLGNLARVGIIFPVYFSGAQSSGGFSHPIGQAVTSGLAQCWRVDITGPSGPAPGTVRLRNAANSVVISLALVPFNEWHVVVVDVNHSNGNATLALYDRDTMTLVATQSVSGGSFGASTDAIRLGRTHTADTSVPVWYMDDVEVWDSAPTLPEPLVISEDPATLDVTVNQYTGELSWSSPVMSGATHVDIFRRTGTDTTTPFDPEVDVRIARVPVGTLTYDDEGLAIGNYVWQVFPVIVQ